MAYPTLVNGQITDAVSQANVTILAAAPAQAMATLYQVMAQSIGLSMQNAVARQRSMAMIDTAVTTQGTSLLYSTPVAAGARGTTEVFSGNGLAELIAALTAVAAMKKG
ncbi:MULTISPECIES: RebB family R body protein [Rhodospirillales]|uniref:R body protein, putative n=2 Tax=Rhodospirillales TaxID=204441 RepID=B6INW9_RHOCS|nr:RebB family R body protein [Rhodospirillum centenum]ACI99389.1 R body protein, putative [Rhodospirillum centenum SW]